jgi:hypothetical protein
MAPAQMGHAKQLDVSAAGGVNPAPSLRGTAAHDAPCGRAAGERRAAATRD